MRVRITLFILIVAALAIPFLVLQAQSTTEAKQAEETAANLEIFTVQPGRVRDFVETTGTLDADAIASISFPVSGRVEAVYVRSGDYVLAGSILAVLDNDFERLLYNQAALRVNDAEVSFYDVQAVDEDSIAIAEANLQAAWNSYAYTRNQLTEADLAAMEAQFRRLRDEADYLELEASQAPGGYGSSAWESLTAEAGETSFNAEIARLQIEAAQVQNEAGAWPAYGRVLEAQAELDRVLAGANSVQIERAEVDLRDAHTQLESALDDYEDTFLIAPFDGVISDLQIEVGATVFANSDVIEMTDITPLTLTIQIDEIDLNDVATGFPVEVSFDAMPGVIVTGTLGNIAPRSAIVNGIVTYEAEILMDMIPAQARVGMSSNVQIITEEINDVLSIPNQFIREDRTTGRITVDILTIDGELIEREIELGLRGVQTSEVTGGLRSGEQLGIVNEVVEINPFE